MAPAQGWHAKSWSVPYFAFLGPNSPFFVPKIDHFALFLHFLEWFLPSVARETRKNDQNLNSVFLLFLRIVRPSFFTRNLPLNPFFKVRFCRLKNPNLLQSLGSTLLCRARIIIIFISIIVLIVPPNFLLFYICAVCDGCFCTVLISNSSY